MARKYTDKIYKTTVAIKRACKQLFEYEQYNFWHFEFGVRAFLLNEIGNIDEYRNCLIKLMSEIKDSQEPSLPDPDMTFEVKNEYGIYIRKIIDNESIKPMYKNIELLNFFDKIEKNHITTLLYYSLTYGIYPHQLTHKKNFIPRVACVVNEKEYAESLTKIFSEEKPPCVDESNINLERIDFLEKFSDTEESDLPMDKLHFSYEPTILQYYSKNSRNHLLKIFNNYEKNISCFTSKQPFMRIFCKSPVNFKSLSLEDINNRNYKEEKDNIYFYISPQKDKTPKYISEKIINILENSENNSEFVLSNMKPEDCNIILQISINKRDKSFTTKKCKIHICSKLTLFYNEYIYNKKNSIKYLYLILPFIIKNENDDAINHLLDSKLDIETKNNFRKILHDECEYINIIHTFTNGYNKQISPFSNALGLAIFDLYKINKLFNKYQLPLADIYKYILAEDQLSSKDIEMHKVNGTFTKQEHEKIKKEIYNDIKRISSAIQSKKKLENITDFGEKLVRAYEQVKKHIESHTLHPIYKS